MEVTCIPATKKQYNGNLCMRKLRVAAYARVSTDQEEQESSYQAQIQYFEDKISSNPEWEFVKVFADEGITGTQAKKRPHFMEMIEECEKGRIDMILVKSISRFSRNITDFIGYIRKLKALGIPVIFEKENINTMDANSEMLLTMLGSFAQAESESISKNVTWGIQKSFSNGNVPFVYKSILGYRKGADGKPEIDPEEAEIVRRVYRMYLAGYSLKGIKGTLEAEGLKTKKGKEQWSTGMLTRMLQNERYMGDALLQKTYTIDCIEHKKVVNNGERPKYYVRDNHPAIIDRDTWNRVQSEIARRGSLKKKAINEEKAVAVNRGKYSSKYALSNVLVCGDCGGKYRRVTWARKSYKRIVWRCTTHMESGAEVCPNAITIDEEDLHRAIMHGINSVAVNQDEMISVLKKSFECALAQSGNIEIPKMEERVKEIEKLLIDAVDNYQIFIDSGRNIDEYIATLTDEANLLRNRIKRETEKQLSANVTAARLQHLFDELETTSMEMKEYSDSIVSQLIERITVNSEEKSISIEFVGGNKVAVAV